ncbi:MAG: Response regulator consisting of a CheY-like receiver domain and a winged-helix DNA-binding domain [Armatimonadetes bacterium]|jgi:DNA-binding response OmpR family regulator|nr:Response regulator consisting of a CheY-like receiver domain and a winged-helix DNA-binding domain [Armatimonadota bacterium]
MPRLLLVDDDRLLLRSLEKLFAAEQYYCRSAHTAAEALSILATEGENAFDLLVLDVGLPDMDGLTACRRVRAHHRLPILMLTARSEITDRVAGLEVGADDYLPKPFDPRELLARVRAQLRRGSEYTQPPEEHEQIPIGGLLLDVGAHVVSRGAEEIPLTSREFELLHLLARHRGKALATNWIFEQLWGYDAELGVKTLTVCVRRLRQKIEVDPARPELLLTVRGFGYKLAG